MFYNTYFGGSLFILFCLPDVYFLRTKQAFLRAKPDKTFQTADPHHRLCVSIYEINKITGGGAEIWSLSSHEHSKINSVSPPAHVLFSLPET